MNTKSIIRPIIFTLCALALGYGAYHVATHAIGDAVGATASGTTSGLAKSAEALSDSGSKIYDTWHERFKVLFQEMDDKFHAVPKITVNGDTVFGGSSSILELTAMQEDMADQYEWSHEWLKSIKTITIKTKYRIKMGFDLKDHFQLNITATSSNELPSARVVLPPPKVLSLETLSYSIIGDNGWWNKLTDADRTTALNEALKHARKKAEGNSGLREETKFRLQSQCITAATSAHLKIEHFVEALP